MARLNPLRNWVWAFVLASLAAVYADLIRQVPRWSPWITSTAFSLAISVALLGGAIAGFLSIVAKALPKWVWPIPWVVAFAIPFLRVAEELGAFANLGGKHHGLALVALGGCAAGTFGLALVAGAVQPRGGTSFVGRRPPWLRMLLSALCLAGAAVLGVADHIVLPELYPTAHVALRLGSIFLAAAALVPHAPEDPDRRKMRDIALAAVAAVGLLYPVAMLDQKPEVASSLIEAPFSGTFLEVVRHATDVDRDQYSSLYGGGDCGALDAHTNPGAFDVPGNGHDENCTGGDASALEVEGWPPVPIPDKPSPASVVLITVDTLRADRMSAYGAKRKTTPKIAAWAANAQRFDAAYTSGLWTTIALPSLLHGVYPRKLRWTLMFGTTERLVRASEPLTDGEKIRSRFALPLDEPRFTMPELLQRRGMRTVAVLDDGRTEILQPACGFSRGFDIYERIADDPTLKNDEGTATLAIDELSKIPGEERFFMWVHFFGPHKPNTTHKEIERFGKSSTDRYDHEIAYLDVHLGRLLDALDARENLVVVMSSDHGEHLRTRGRHHGTNGREGNVRIPLFVKGSGFAKGTNSLVTSTVDIAPTVLAATKTPSPQWFDGHDLRAALSQKPQHENRVVFSDSFIYSKTASQVKFDLAAAISPTHKLIRQRVKRTEKLVKRSTDAPDKRNKKALHQLSAALDAYLETFGGRLDVGP